MSQNSPPGPLKQFLANFSQIGAIVAAVTLVIQLIIGDVPGLAYGQTLSALSLVVLAVLLWLWRWPKIMEGRKRRGSKASGGGNRYVLEGVLKPFRASEGKVFVLSTTRRRFEGAFLAMMSVTVVLLIIPKMNRIGEELSGFRCLYAENHNAPLVAIAGFNDLTEDESAFENRLFTKMDEEFNNQLSVCLSRQVVVDRKDAREFGESLKGEQASTLVVWGDSDSRSLVVRVTPLEWEAFALEIRADASDAGEIEGWAETYMPQIVQGWTQFIEGDNPAAIRTLDSVTRKLEDEPWSGNNQEAFARLYFQLAYLYEAVGQPDPAIAAYSKVLDNDPDFDDALLARGLLFKVSDPEKAINDFTALIDKGSYLAAYAYAIRSSMQTEWELMRSDLRNAIALDPEDPENYRVLGMNALFEGEFETALKAYEDVRGLLDEETRVFFVEELQAAVEKDGSLKDIVEQIILVLNTPSR